MRALTAETSQPLLAEQLCDVDAVTSRERTAIHMCMGWPWLQQPCTVAAQLKLQQHECSRHCAA